MDGARFGTTAVGVAVGGRGVGVVLGDGGGVEGLIVGGGGGVEGGVVGAGDAGTGGVGGGGGAGGPDAVAVAAAVAAGLAVAAGVGVAACAVRLSVTGEPCIGGSVPVSFALAPLTVKETVAPGAVQPLMA